jgi:tetratricopeptide (TPR) repeat protein
LLGIALLAFAGGCSTPRIVIERSCPPCIQIEPSAKVGLEIVIEIPSSARKIEALTETVIDALGGQVLTRRAATEPVRLELDRHLQRGPNPVVDVRDADYIVRACPTEWSYHGQNGSGYLRVRIDVVRAKRPEAPCVYSSTYWSKVHAPDEVQAMARAADLVSDRFVADLRPSRICNVVDMDDSDPSVETGITLCRCGHFDAAYTAFSDLAAKAPNSAPVLYNLGVLKESRGEYDGAEALLLQAIKIEPKGMYYVALERVRAARLDAEALGKTP